MNKKLFGEWKTENISVSDQGIRKYVNADSAPLHTFGMYSNKRFGKANYNVVERLAKKLMVTGHVRDSRKHKKTSGRDTGKKQRAFRIVKDAFEKIESKTDKNPVQVLLSAVEKSAPCEETTKIRQGGIIVHKAVDVAPQRRVDLALGFISHGAAQRAFKKKQSISGALAEELISASNNDNKTYSVSKKEELERVAASAR